MYVQFTSYGLRLSINTKDLQYSGQVDYQPRSEWYLLQEFFLSLFRSPSFLPALTKGSVKMGFISNRSMSTPPTAIVLVHGTPCLLPYPMGRLPPFPLLPMHIQELGSRTLPMSPRPELALPPTDRFSRTTLHVGCIVLSALEQSSAMSISVLSLARLWDSATSLRVRLLPTHRRAATPPSPTRPALVDERFVRRSIARSW